MTSLLAQFAPKIKQDWKSFWDGIVKPEIKVLEAALENLQRELAPLEEAALKAAVGAGLAAAAAAGGGVVPATVEAALPILAIGAKAAIAEAESQGVKLSAQAALTLLSGASVPVPVVANGANG